MYPEVTTAIEAWLQKPDIHRLDDPQLLENGQLKSGSNWTWQHVNAFRIVPVLDVALQDVLPAQYFPSCEESIMQQCQAFWVMNRDDIHNHNTDKLFNNIISRNIFVSIASCIDTLMGVVDRRRSHDSDLSHTSNEAEAETESATNALSRAICRLFLQVTNLHNKSPPSWDFVSRHENMPITILRSIQGNVKNDGAILHINQSRKRTIHIWLESKPYKYSPMRALNYEKTIPQKIAESLSLAQNQPVREIFGIEFSHKYAAFWSIAFTDQYIIQSKNNVVLDPTNPMIMKRSKIFDLIEQSDRREFAQCFIGLLHYKSATVTPE